MTESNQYKSFIIHLDRAEGRKSQVEDIIKKSPFDSQIINAVDGALLDGKEIEKCYSSSSFLIPKYPFPLTKGEVGCFLSHRNAWKQIVNQKLIAGLVFEDDVQIEPSIFKKAVNLAKNHIHEYGYIQFQVRKLSDDIVILSSNSDVNLAKPSPILLRCSVQLISQSTAKQLLELTEKFDRPVDGFLQMDWHTKIPIICITPSGVSDRTQETGGSTLSIRQPLLKKFNRTLKRHKYRTQIRKFSRNNIKNTS